MYVCVHMCVCVCVCVCVHTGLDAASAYFVMDTVRTLALHNRTILTVIHQPSSEVFELFDQLALLSNGNVVYFGPAKEALNMFEAAGLPCPAMRCACICVCLRVCFICHAHTRMCVCCTSVYLRRYVACVLVGLCGKANHHVIVILYVLLCVGLLRITSCM